MRIRRLAFAVALALPLAAPAAAQRAADVPNVVLIITDDLGWGDLGVHGATDIRTPNIDALARQGVRFAEFYANGVLCTPTRAGLISGRYQQRFGLEAAFSSVAFTGPKDGLPVTGSSLPALLKARGYATALVGKWHLGYLPEYSPAAHGFDYFFGLKSGYHDFYTHRGRDGQLDLWENDQRVEVEGYSTDLITARALQFIERQAAGPFFIDVAYNAPHWPYQPPDRPSVSRDSASHLMPYDSATSTRADYAAMVERVDRGVGEILAALDHLGIAERTLVIFTNDNGGEWLADNGPFFHRKWTVWEGGIRVPAIARWPGRIPAGTVSQQVGITMDLSATILALAGVAPPSDVPLDGIDLMPIITGQAATRERQLFWRTAVGGQTQRAVRDGRWKLVVDGTHQLLFDLQRDRGERNDLANARQDIARRLWLSLQAWEAEVNAEREARGRAP